ncbi:hypothetical protein [Nocardia brasiliensis]|uniref:hypothetical protein n=1 Tax=Nocardia brasiliensis TaxID=37326 RepID=UPI002457921A|nr:hypothetical protein [Nocardia brasiliensis]
MLALGAGYLTIVGVLRYRMLVLPQPGGDHPVGRMMVTVPSGTADDAEPLRAAWIWYPADRNGFERAPRAEYAPAGWREGALPPTLGLGWLLQDIRRVRPWAHAGAPVAPGRWPMIALVPGHATAPWMYTSLGEHLASRGYVAAILVPPTTPARVVDGRSRTNRSTDSPAPQQIDSLAEKQAADLVSLYGALGTDRVEQLAGHVDPDNVVFGGHSLGGMAAAIGCDRERRCIGSLNLDGPQPPPRQENRLKPRLLIASYHSCVVTRPCDDRGLPEAHLDWLTRRYALSPPEWGAGITGAGHNSFGDPPFYFVAPPAGQLTGTGTLPADRVHAVLTTTVRAAISSLRDTRNPPRVDQLVRDLPELEPLQTRPGP